MARTVIFDATRIVERRNRMSPTGIDRVVLAYAGWLLSGSERLMPVVNRAGNLVPLPRERLARHVEDAHRSIASPGPSDEQHENWRRLVAALGSRPKGGQALRAGSEPVLGGWVRRASAAAGLALRARANVLEHGACYLNVGHSGLERPGLLAGIVARGAVPVVMIHDLIPISHPEFCGPLAADRHRLRVDGALEHAALIIANSNSTADDITSYAKRHARRLPPIHVGLLGVEPSFLKPPTEPISAPPYFVCVGTIEPRKNLAFLLMIWRRLAERMGPLAPHLVLVGNRGWENETVVDQLERSHVVTSLVHEVANLGDCHVASLVAGARALLAPSLAEGFDLPVVEALSLGTPVIASDIPVHRELAPPAMLIDPLDGPAWLAALKAAAVTPVRRSPYEPPTWESHFAGIRRVLALGEDNLAGAKEERLWFG